MDFGLLFYTFFFGKLAGRDEFGNKYYHDKKKRWAMYSGIAEASKIPPPWHAWLHYMTDEVPQHTQVYAWQKQHVPNLTGTSAAHYPAGHLLRNKERKTYGHYQPWRPD
ncbi:NADH dehydrogenase [Rickettsiales bacterium]|nr:NADH dehydrogenase [Rickettsiales bacterium]